MDQVDEELRSRLATLATAMPDTAGRLDAVGRRARRMHTRKRLAVAGGGVASVALLAGVAAGLSGTTRAVNDVPPAASPDPKQAPATPEATPASPTGTPSAFMNIRRAGFYRDLRALRLDSVAVARVTATAQRSVVDGPGATTVTSVTVDQVLAGELPQERIDLAQLGSATVGCDCPPVVVAGRSYVVFLVRGDRPGAGTAEYAVTGLAGLYGYASADRLVRLDAYSRDLPAALSEAALRRAIGA